MRISIITVNWNGKRWLNTCLTSISNQELSEEFEIILVDNGSIDDSIKFVRENFPKIKVVALDRNYGFAEGNNMGIREAKGEYLVFVNNDTQVETCWLKNLVDAAEENPEYKILCSIQLPLMKANILAIDHFFGLTKISYFRTSKDVLKSNFAHGGCFLLRKDWLAKVGYLFNPSYFCFGEDLDLSLRTILAGGKIGYVKKSRMWHFLGGSGYNESWLFRIMQINALRTYQKLFQRNFTKILLVKFLFALLIFVKAPTKIKANIGNLTGLIDFMIYRRNFVRKDKIFTKFHGNAILNERELLQKISYQGSIGKLVKMFILNV